MLRNLSECFLINEETTTFPCGRKAQLCEDVAFP